MKNKLLSATLSYYGGKTKLAFYIIKQAFKMCPQITTFIDAFAGGGSVSLAAKLNNLQVISNDHAFHSFCYNKAIIENTNVKLDNYDILKIYHHELYEQISNDKIPDVKQQKELLFKYIPIKMHTDFFITASYLNNKIKIFHNEYKHYMMNALITKSIIKLLPFSMASGILYNHVVTQTYNVKLKSVKDFKRLLKPTIKIIQNTMNDLNYAVFNNGKKNIVYNMDVEEFLKTIQDKVDVNKTVVYLDPPYKDALKTYEEMYKFINIILFAKPKPTSEFNKLTAKQKILNLLTYKFNYYIISYAGEYFNEIVDTVSKLGVKHEIITIPYRWSIAQAEQKEIVTNEYLLLVTKNEN